MAKTIPALFDSYADAERAVGQLEAAGVNHDDISVVSSTTGGDHDTAHRGDDVGNDAGKGAGAGAIVGGAGGLLAGLGALAIPGLGPIVALGWLASTAAGAAAGSLVGAAAGGIVGALTHAGVSPEDADAYAEGVRRGGTLVTVRVPDELAPKVQEIFAGALASVDIGQRRESYVASGWTRFDDAAPAYTAEEIAAERARYGRV